VTNLHAIILLLILAVGPATAFAQTPLAPTRGPAPSMVFGVRAHGPLRGTLAPADTLRPVSIGTYAKEGAIAGGLLGAVGGGLLAEVACGLSEDPNKNCTGSFLIGGVLGAPFGALPGALIGGLFPKYPKNTRLFEPE
jgi:hypothetical protein